MIENNAGAKDRMPDTRAKAMALRVPRVACVGAMSLSANWMAARNTKHQVLTKRWNDGRNGMVVEVGEIFLLNAIAHPDPNTKFTGAIIQNATFQ